MDLKQNAQQQHPELWRTDTPQGRAYQVCIVAIGAALKTLSTANKNRVLLGLHSVINDTLEALSTNND